MTRTLHPLTRGNDTAHALGAFCVTALATVLLLVGCGPDVKKTPAMGAQAKAAAAQDYAQFYKQELRFRQLMHYPPFAALANLMVRSESQENVLKLTGLLGRFMESLQEDKQKGRGWRLLGPAAAPIPKLKKSYRYHFLIKAEQRSILRRVLIAAQEFARREKFPANALIVDVDPQSLL